MGWSRLRSCSLAELTATRSCIAAASGVSTSFTAGFTLWVDRPPYRSPPRWRPCSPAVPMPTSSMRGSQRSASPTTASSTTRELADRRRGEGHDERRAAALGVGGRRRGRRGRRRSPRRSRARGRRRSCRARARPRRARSARTARRGRRSAGRGRGRAPRGARPRPSAADADLDRRARPACARARCAAGWRAPGAAGGRRRMTDGRPVARPARSRGRAPSRARRRRRRRRAGRGRPRSCGASATSSSRASVSRSSTSTPMRAASSSIRLIAFSTSSGSRAAPIRNSSA